MPQAYYVVDAFTSEPFAGNPAAVCPLTHWPAEWWLNNVAREMNLSETAFVVNEGENRFQLRWFTPIVEVDLCGHATLASAVALWKRGYAQVGQPISFATRSGTLVATPLAQSEWVELDFPLKPETQAEPPPMLLESLGSHAVYVGRNQFDFLIELESEEQLRRLTPDFGRLRHVACRGVIVTARSRDPRFDFVSRFFAPAAGINEDPVTGSAHCCLVDYWSRQLGKTEFVAFQASERGGVVRVRLENGRALLGGQAVLIAQGELFAAP